MKLTKRINALCVSALVVCSLVSPITKAEALDLTSHRDCSSLSQNIKEPSNKNEVASIAKNDLIKQDYAGDVDWEKSDVQEVSPGKNWVTFPVKETSDGSVKFHRVAVDMDKKEAVTIQTYIINPSPESHSHHSTLLADGELIWEGTVDNDGNVTTAPDSPMNPAYRTRGKCEWIVGTLCGTGGGAGCYGACALLGLANGIAGLGCSTVCGLIATVGCTAATNKICG